MQGISPFCNLFFVSVKIIQKSLTPLRGCKHAPAGEASPHCDNNVLPLTLPDHREKYPAEYFIWPGRSKRKTHFYPFLNRLGEIKARPYQCNFPVSALSMDNVQTE